MYCWEATIGKRSDFKRKPRDYPKYDPFDSEAHYRAVVKEAGGVYPAEGLKPV